MLAKAILHTGDEGRGSRPLTAFFRQVPFRLQIQGNEGPQGPREKKGDKGGFGLALLMINYLLKTSFLATNNFLRLNGYLGI